MDTKSSKRRRFATNSAARCTIYLSDLPVEPLTHVASFLAVPSRALFAVALNFASSDDSSSSTSIVCNQVDTLDFGDIGRDLAAKLSDDDISAILLCSQT